MSTGWLILIMAHVFAALWSGCFAYGVDVDPWKDEQ